MLEERLACYLLREGEFAFLTILNLDNTRNKEMVSLMLVVQLAMFILQFTTR